MIGESRVWILNNFPSVHILMDVHLTCEDNWSIRTYCVTNWFVFDNDCSNSMRGYTAAWWQDTLEVACRVEQFTVCDLTSLIVTEALTAPSESRCSDESCTHLLYFLFILSSSVISVVDECLQDFCFRGRQWRGLKDRSPSARSGAAPRWGSRVKPPEADIFSKWCINTSSTEVLDNICMKKTLFNISRGKEGASAPMSIPAGAHGFVASSVQEHAQDVLLPSLIRNCLT